MIKFPWFTREQFEEHKMKLAAAVLVLGLMAVWIAAGRRHPSSSDRSTRGQNSLEDNPNRIPAPVFVVKKAPFSDTLLITGTIKGGSEIELRFRSEGKLSAFHFKVGDKVKKDDIIAQLDPKDSYIKLQQAEIELDQHKKLLDVGGIIPAKYEQARLAAELARSEYERTFLRAPGEGHIGEKNVEVGESITPQMRIATLVNTQTVLAEMGIIEKDAEKISIGQEVTLIVDSYKGQEFDGKIINIAPIFIGKSRTMTAKALLDNAEGLLKPGMFARCQVAVYSSSNTIAIPANALTADPSKPEVFVVEDKVATARAVKTGHISHDYAEILEGLSEGEMVVAEVTEAIKEGVEIEAMDTQEQESAPLAEGENTPEQPLAGP